jgi:hypothetical protein
MCFAPAALLAVPGPDLDVSVVAAPHVAVPFGGVGRAIAVGAYFNSAFNG